MQMNSYFRNSIIFLIVLFALLALISMLTDAWQALLTANLIFLLLAAVFFMVSVLLWIISWAYLVKKRSDLSYSNLLKVGIVALYGALTPVQLGAEALRAIKLKQLFSIPYSVSVSSAMVSKGAKFLIIAIAAAASIFFIAASRQIDAVFLFYLASGLAVVLLAAAFFLLPLNTRCGNAIAVFFKKISKRVKHLSKIADYFEKYPSYLKETKKAGFVFVFLLAAASWIFEFFALYFSFLSFDLFLPLTSVLFLTVIVSILERTPFLPRGIGAVELLAYNYLAFPQFLNGIVLSAPQIAAVLVVYAVVRIVIPTIISMICNLFFFRNLSNPAK